MEDKTVRLDYVSGVPVITIVDVVGDTSNAELSNQNMIKIVFDNIDGGRIRSTMMPIQTLRLRLSRIGA